MAWCARYGDETRYWLHAAYIAPRKRLGTVASRRVVPNPQAGANDSPGAIRKRIRHPVVATVRVVFNEDETATRPQICAETGNDRRLIADEMERVCHHDAVERRQIERPREVAAMERDRDGGERRPQRLRLRAQGAGIPIDRMDRRAVAEELREGERERTAPGADVRPDWRTGLRIIARRRARRHRGSAGHGRGGSSLPSSSCASRQIV